MDIYREMLSLWCDVNRKTPQTQFDWTEIKRMVDFAQRGDVPSLGVDFTAGSQTFTLSGTSN